MAKKSSRTRAQRKRADYRKGGRVAYQEGGYGGYEGENEGFNVKVDVPRINIPEIPTYTAADVDKAYADLNAGTISAAQLAKQYGVSEEYVNANLAAHNASTPAASGQTSTVVDPTNMGETTGVTEGTIGTTEGGTAGGQTVTLNKAGDQITDETFDPNAAATTTTTPAATVASIPADGDYSAAETKSVVDAINSGATTQKKHKKLQQSLEFLLTKSMQR